MSKDRLDGMDRVILELYAIHNLNSSVQNGLAMRSLKAAHDTRTTLSYTYAATNIKEASSLEYFNQIHLSSLLLRTAKSHTPSALHAETKLSGRQDFTSSRLHHLQ